MIKRIPKVRVINEKSRYWLEYPKGRAKWLGRPFIAELSEGGWYWYCYDMDFIKDCGRYGNVMSIPKEATRDPYPLEIVKARLND